MEQKGITHKQKPYNWKGILGSSVCQFLAKKRRSKPIKVLVNYLEILIDGYYNSNYDMNLNGESRVLSRLASLRNCELLFDVGANEGEWCKMALAMFPGAKIHAFEVNPSTCRRLQANLSGVTNIIPHAYGLADKEETVDLYEYNEDSELTSILDKSSYRRNVKILKAAGRLRYGEEVCKELGVETIDMMKIDVEGVEVRVLNGLLSLIQSKRIRVIQFEYGRSYILSRAFLADLHAQLVECGYVVGKIYPNYVDFRPYDWMDEDFRGPNYLAVVSDEKDIISSMR